MKNRVKITGSTLVAMAIILIFAPKVQAQEIDITYSLRTNVSLYDAKLRNINFVYDYGISYNRWSLVGCYERAADFIEGGGTNDYQIIDVFGAAASYNFLSIDKGTFDLRAMWGTTAYDDKWKYQLYDVGVSYVISTGASLKPFVGLGARYYDFSTAPINNQLKSYFTFGFKF